MRPIRLIVPQAAGSASDTVARLVAAELVRQMNQQIVIDNRPGGALMIGMELVAHAPPDGYTIGTVRSARWRSDPTWCAASPSVC